MCPWELPSLRTGAGGASGHRESQLQAKVPTELTPPAGTCWLVP